MSDKPRKPRAIKTTQKENRPSSQKAASPHPRQPRSIRDLSSLEFVPDEAANRASAPDEIPSIPPPRRRRSFAVILLVAAGGLVSLYAGIAIDRFVRELFIRNEWLGWIGLALAATLALALLGMVLREIWSLARLAQISRIRKRGARAATENDRSRAIPVLAELNAIYASRPDTAHGRKLVADHAREIIDGADLIRLAERDLLGPLDSAARTMVMDAAKRVSVVTAVSPRAVVDLAYVLIENLRLIRRLSELYGGRPGTLGFWRLAGNVISHLAATGAIAAGDSIIHQILGHGLAARLSARLGEGVVNGLLTARIGISAMDVCRPLPFIFERRPAIAGFLGELARIGGVRESERKGLDKSPESEVPESNPRSRND